MEKVSVVILNYLNYKDTIECIESVKKDNYKSKKRGADFMKRKLVQESLIYCILPIIAIAVFYNQYPK